MAPVKSYTNWNSRATDEEEQIEPYRKYFFICEGVNTETWYIKKLIDIRKSLNSNLAFELFLLLHFENSYKQEIIPNQEKIIKNEKEGNQTFIYKLLLSKTGINSKKNSQIGELAEKVDIAIMQEKKMNEDIHDCKGKITCNIGKIIIESIRNDEGV